MQCFWKYEDHHDGVDLPGIDQSVHDVAERTLRAPAIWFSPPRSPAIERRNDTPLIAAASSADTCHFRDTVSTHIDRALPLPP
jgi:hypothetical protein